MKKARNILVVTLMLLSVLSFGSVANTYAKYTSTAELSDTAKVAKWDVRLDGKKFWAEDRKKTVDLFSGDLIAPGSTGTFDTSSLEITNYSDVVADFKIEMTAKVKSDNPDITSIPLEYCVDADCTAEGATWTDTIPTIEVKNVAKGGAKATFDKVVTWRWAFKGNDEVDTKLGMAAADALNDEGIPSIELTIKVIATQSTPGV